MTKNETTITLRDVVYQIPNIEDFINAVMTIPDQTQAAGLVEEQAGLIFDMATAGELGQIENDIDDAQEPFNQSKLAIAEQQKQLTVTTPTIKAAAYLNTTRPTQDSAARMSLGQIKDILVGATGILLGCAVVGMGASNVYAIIMASGTPAFLDNPKLAIMLSGLLPIGSVALKFFSNYLPSDRAKKRYTMTMYGLSAISLIAWVVLFGMTFQSAGSGIDWDSFGAASNSGMKGEFFTVVQLLAELFVGATLFIVAGDIFSMYSPTTLLANPAYEERKQNLESMRTAHNKIADNFKQKQARFEVLRAARKAYINTQLAAYMRLSARLNGSDDVSLKQNKESKTMKNLLLKTLLIGAVLTGLSGQAQAKNFYIGLSPVLSHEAAARQTKEVLQFLTRNVQAGEQAVLFDAWDVRTIGTFSVPESAAYSSEKAKLQFNRALVGRLMDMSRADSPMLSSAVTGAVKLPQFLEFLGQNYAPLEDADILVLGSPIYVDLQSPQMSMTGGKFAGDGHFSAPPADTPFSVVGKENLLKGARVHVYIPDQGWAVNDSYAYMVKRMWTLFIEGQGGVLSSFTDDPQTFWQRAGSSATALPHTFKREETSKLETLVIEQKESSIKPIYERDLTTLPPSPETLRMAENVEIGISWTCQSCDIDLYVRPYNRAQVLYFGQTQSNEGLYHKDFIRSPVSQGGFETVSFTVPVDLRDTLVAINWFRGAAPEGVSGEVRLAIGDKTYGLPFQIKAADGNAALGRDETLQSGQPANDRWLVINPKTILGL